jgi:hypothetical protein
VYERVNQSLFVLLLLLLSPTHLVEVLCIAQHLAHDLPAVIALRAADHKLLHLLKLVDPAAAHSTAHRDSQAHHSSATTGTSSTMLAYMSPSKTC